MKQTRKIPALLLAMLLLASLALTSCQKSEAPLAADQVAVALFEMILKDDASAAVSLFGYADEAEALADWGIEDGSLYEQLADQIVDQYSGTGFNVSTEDVQTFIDAFVSMFKNVEMTAVVKESDEKAGTAVVTCTISTFDPNAMTDAMTEAMSTAMTDPAILESGDMDAAVSQILNSMSSAIAGLTPSGETADFDVDFELSSVEINGKARTAWLPVDADAFGSAISSNALGGFGG